MRYTVCVYAVLLASAALAQQSPPKSMVKTPVVPVKVERRTDGVFFIDFGRDAFAQFNLKLDAADARQVMICLGEKLKAPDHLDPKPGGSIRFLQTTLADGYAVLPKADARRMPADIGPVMPFRYVELKGLPEYITVEAITKTARQEMVNYPFDDNAAEFVCSDEKLNAVWNLSKYSIKATSFAGVFVDGDRERKPYEADAYINGLGWYCCTDDLTLPAFTDHYLIDHPTWPTEWSMFTVLCAWNDYLYTGDLDALRQAYPELKAKSLRALERQDGLISVEKVPPSVIRSLHLGKEPLKDIVDWPVAERDGYDMKPFNTVVNAFHCRSLILLSQMAAALGDRVGATDFQSAAEKSAASLNAKLFDKVTGLYIDGEGSSHSSEHANMFPLAFGLVPLNRRDGVVAFLRQRGMACSVYGAQFLLDGLFDNDRGNDAIELMLAPGDRSWRHMVEETGTTITLEAWDQKYKPNQDWNHAWGAAAANLIPRKVLGIEPADPGFAKITIRPRDAGKSSTITWARGKVPTVKGPISIDWKEMADEFRLKTDLPAGTTAEVYMPRDWGSHMTVDDKTISTAGAGDQSRMISGFGTHVITVGR